MPRLPCRPLQALNGLISVLVFNIIYDLLLRRVQGWFV